MTVQQWTDIEDDRGTIWESPRINWGCGGRGGDFPCDEIQGVKNLTAAFQKAIEIAERWQKRAGQPVKPGDV